MISRVAVSLYAQRDFSRVRVVDPVTHLRHSYGIDLNRGPEVVLVVVRAKAN